MFRWDQTLDLDYKVQESYEIVKCELNGQVIVIYLRVLEILIPHMEGIYNY